MGASVGEHDTVTVTISTSGLSDGLHEGFVSIFSNGGDANFEIKLTIKKERTKDIHNFESDWATLEVTMPRNKAINTPFSQFLQNYPNLFLIITLLLQ